MKSSKDGYAELCHVCEKWVEALQNWIQQVLTEEEKRRKEESFSELIEEELLTAETGNQQAKV